MALRFVSVLLCTIFAIGTALALPPPPLCGQNAQRQICGSACAPTCSNPNPGPTCILPCINGCFCKEGYLKAANGACVRPDECDSIPHLPNMQIPQFNAQEAPPKCGADEEYRTCGSACIPTCAMPLPKPWCTRQCAVGCYCKEGYLRNEQNVCIPAMKCKLAAGLGPINIPLHRVPVSLPTPDVPFPIFEPGPVILPPHPFPLPLGPGPVILPTPEVPFLPLEPGPVIFPTHDDQASTLGPINIPLRRIPITHPPFCPQNELYNTCGVQLDCLASCKTPMTPKCMERMCTPGCVCQKPYVRHPNGRCVEKTECPKN